MLYNVLVSTQVIPFEINLKKEKWLAISIYRVPLQNSEYLLNYFTKIIEYFADTCDNQLIFGDFNLESTDSALVGFLGSSNLIVQEPINIFSLHFVQKL